MWDDPADLENAVLDALEEADDAADAPPGTVPLSAARRHRSLDEVQRLIGEGPPAR
jgi:hypothetical protein